MCTYNGSKFLEEQLASIGQQSRLPDELIICDDCSSDDTLAKLRDFAAHASFPVRVIANECNLGYAKNFEKAISLCQYDIIALSDQDDVWTQTRLQRTAEIFMRNESVGVVFGDADLIDEKSRRIGRRLWARVRATFLQRLQLRRRKATQALLRKNVVTGATMAFRSTFRDVALPIPRTWVHDGWIALVVSYFADLYFVKEPLIQYRTHPNQNMGIPTGYRLEFEQAKKTQRQEYVDEIRQYEFVHDRLFPYVKTEKQKAAIDSIRGKMMHLSARAGMPEGTIARFAVILRELITMRYSLYSRGFLSAVRDAVMQ